MASACGGSTSIEVPNNFPSEKEVRELTQGATSVELNAPRDTAAVSEWQLEGPLPTEIGLSERMPTTKGEVIVQNAMQGNSESVLSESMHCVARETGIFFASKGKWPFESLENFMEARCGALSFPSVRVFTVDGEANEEQMLDPKTKAKVTDYVKDLAAVLDHPEFGVAMGMAEGTTYLAIAYGDRAVSIAPTTMVADDDESVTFVGDLLTEDPESISAAITQGDFGFAYCEVDTRLSLPKFRFTCPTRGDDSHAYISIAVNEKGSMISNFVSLFYVSPTGELLARYTSPATRRAIRDEMERRAQRPETEEPEAPMTGVKESSTQADQTEKLDAAASDEDDALASSETLEEVKKPTAENIDVEPKPIAQGIDDLDSMTYSEATVEIVNSVRRTAGLGPVELSVAQTDENDRIAPAYFAARQNDQSRVADKLMMGTIAGWKVQGNITRGHFFSSMQVQENPAEFLESYLETPHGRSTLLRPDVGSMAIGTAQAGNGLGVIVSSYRFLEKQTFKDRWQLLVEDINRQRRQRGLPQAKISKKAIATARRVSAEMERGQTGLGDAIDQVVEQVQLKYKEPSRGWYFHAYELKDINWPKPILNDRSMRVSIAVAPIQPEGYPWTVYAIAIGYPDRE